MNALDGSRAVHNDQRIDPGVYRQVTVRREQALDDRCHFFRPAIFNSDHGDFICMGNIAENKCR